jgi:predicted TIM-barrel fold metal-dependent hydrolase
MVGMRSEAEPPPSSLFVDAHHHLWDLERHRYAWLTGSGEPQTTDWIGDYGAIRSSYSIDDYLSDAGSELIKSVHVEAGWSGPDRVMETRWLQGIADVAGFPHAIVAAVDLCEPDAGKALDRHLENGNMRGVRMTAMGDLVSRKSFRRGFAALAERDLVYDLNIHAEDVQHATSLAEAFPATTIVVDNMANPSSLSREAFERWCLAMRELAMSPNVVMKVSGLGMAEHHWSVDGIAPWVLAALEIFTPDRCMFGSNWPVDSLYGSFARLLAAVREVTAQLTADDQDLLFRRTAERVYRV